MSERGEVLWEVKHLTKIFPGVKALDDVSMQFHRGEIHGLIGENESGKSTLIKCLSGVYQPEEGDIYHQGKLVHVSSPIAARKMGVATIFQEFSLVPTLSVVENIFLGRLLYKENNRLIDWKKMRNEAEELLDGLDIDIDPSAVVKNLSVAQQQLVEIAKALSIHASLLIMDEPTAALGQSEIERLHLLTRKLRDQGYAIIYISHRLDEMESLVDRVTVLKDGVVTGECGRQEISVSEIVRIMIGSDIENHYPKEHNGTEEVILQAENLTTRQGARHAGFELYKGEVLGFAGLIGSGRTQIARGIFGADSLLEGSLKIDGRKVRIRRPQDAIRAGVAFVTENRKSDGLFMNFHAGPNISVVKLEKLLQAGLLSLKKEESSSREYVHRLKITPTALEKSVRFLSGGNQQKVVIARWLFSQAEIFIMDEPTQGIDVQAKVEVYQLMNRLTAAGKAVILISSDFPELIAMSDRLAIVRDGTITETVPVGNITRKELMEITMGRQNSQKSGRVRS